MSTLDNARAALALMKRIGDDGWCLCVKNGAQNTVRDALDDLIAHAMLLTEWKAEAMAVLSEWEQTWHAAGRPGRPGSLKAVAVREMIERLTAPPSADEREALATVIARVSAEDDIAPPSDYDVADAILASPVWRNRAPWDRADGRFGHCDPEGWHAPCRNRGKVTVTDEMVDMADAMYDRLIGMQPASRMRAALEAALEVEP
jgi:hypothetical protein